MDGEHVHVPDTSEIEGTIRGFSAVLEDLQAGHAKLAERAERVEAELCRTNAKLAAKVAELDEVKHHLEAILTSLPTGVVVRDAAGHIVRVNEAALEILGCGSEEVIGRTTCEGLQGPQAAGQPREFQRADGQRLVLCNRYSAVRLEDGEPAGSVEILDDRTALEAMTRRVHQLDKMAALGTMAGGIAHEIRNPMNAVKGFAALLAEQQPEGSKGRHWARLIQDGVDECNTIVGSILTFAQPENLHQETVSGEQLVEEALATVRRDLDRTGITDRYELTSDVQALDLVCDRIKLRQALRNLVANAVEAQPDGGRVHVALTQGDERVTLRVTDAGPGICSDLVHRVADPFFTTQADGTGLGLALVHTIARLHGGSLEVEAEPAPLGGADFRISIPQSPATHAP